MFKGVKKIKTEADFVVFKGPGRDLENTLLVIEAKKSDKDITADHIGQAKSYAHELLPACYIITNGQQIKVYWFNGTLLPDKLVMDIDKSMLREKWAILYGYASKEAAIQRKERIIDRTREFSEEDLNMLNIMWV
jgi:type I site-specific restriction endonuclease